MPSSRPEDTGLYRSSKKSDMSDMGGGSDDIFLAVDPQGASSTNMRSCRSIFNTVEELHGYLLIRRASPLTEDE